MALFVPNSSVTSSYVDIISGVLDQTLGNTTTTLTDRDLSISGSLQIQILAGAVSQATLDATGAKITSLSGALIASGDLLWNRSSSISGGLQARIDGIVAGVSQATLNATGALITSLSGWSASAGNLTQTGAALITLINALPTAGQLSTTGSVLWDRDVSISGVLDSRLFNTGAAAITYSNTTFGTITNLGSTGQQAWTTADANARNLSGVLSQTGTTLRQRDLDISGVLQTQIGGLSRISSLQNLTGTVTIIGTGGINISTQGQNIVIGPPFIRIPLSVGPITATNATLAPQFFAGSSAYVTQISLNGYTGVRFVLNKGAAAGATAYGMFLRYLGNYSITATDYLAITNPEMKVQSNFQNVMITSGFLPIVVGAMSGVCIALISSGNDGVLDPIWGNIYADFM